jgi:hypothetical protein
MTTVIAVLTLALVLGLTLVLHKIIRMHKKLFRVEEEICSVRASLRADRTERVERELANLYAQFQAYHDLVRLLSPAAPFPRLRGWAASPDFLLIISQHALIHKPAVILECSSGASTVALAQCCQLNGGGHVYSLEHAPVFAIKTRELLAAHGLSGWATAVDAPLQAYPDLENRPWYSLVELPDAASECGMLVIDGPPESTAELARYPALPLLVDRLAARCTVFLDDYHRDHEQRAVRRWLDEIPGFALEPLDAEKGCARLTRA